LNEENASLLENIIITITKERDPRQPPKKPRNITSTTSNLRCLGKEEKKTPHQHLESTSSPLPISTIMLVAASHVLVAE
jgi:hypothetical protein